MAPGCKITSPKNVSVGTNCYFGRAKIYSIDKLSVGSFSIIGDGVFLCTGSHDIWSKNFNLVTKPIAIGSYVWIASDATVLPGVTIGDHAVIGAGAVVSRSVPPRSVSAGNLSRVVAHGRQGHGNLDPISFGVIDWRTSLRRLIAAVRRNQGNGGK